ncbi:MAG: DUF2225 domain-containing protein [Clostridiales bacterium]|nr:DUF2225 domain-containing protein [Clostridiales bacterium]
MPDLFKGLERFGLDSYKDVSLYEKETKDDKGENSKEEKKINPEDYLYDKKYECPVCGAEVSATTVRTTKLRLVKEGFDFRKYYEPIDPLLYDVVICGKCGYSALQRDFNKLRDSQVDLIKKNITPKFQPAEYPRILDVPSAIERYQLALLNAIVKNARSSEKAYICLKMGWLYRENGDADSEKGCFKEAYTGFSAALAKEQTPIYGVFDESTVTYFLAVCCYVTGDIDMSRQILSKLIVSRNVPPKLRERARELKDLLQSGGV